MLPSTAPSYLWELKGPCSVSGLEVSVQGTDTLQVKFHSTKKKKQKKKNPKQSNKQTKNQTTTKKIHIVNAVIEILLPPLKNQNCLPLC